MATIGSLLLWAITIYSYMIIAYILMSWFPNARESSFGQFLGSIVEPYLAPFRKIIPPLGMIDISPIVAIFALTFARYGVHAIFF
ncbi:YggT family protein [Halalkalibacterium halodurans]|uniref:YggT family protein n=1 Tax=Halalkalibacterium halodurans TaxID=86665 RepID=A0A0M0KIK5_ALKHA|nr:YggT family protein [Halalkalibacterium halodurans]MED3646146.1 YggT family protein [Halalkalibacterium halodurans]TES53834.1 YggT family protein [Halalkalibacterium halodurans]TPE66253.1 YggT family protein [Halalkalibacterium halodurans]